MKTDLLYRSGPMPRIVGLGWVEACVAEGTVMGEDEWVV